MLFNSLTFVYFFFVVLAVNYALPPRWRNAWILAASVLFYASWSPLYILLLLGTALIDYKVAIKMASLPTQREKKRWLVGSIIFSLGSLALFKYTNMFLLTAGTVGKWFGSHWQPGLYDIVLPLGISFYTFETISYGVDVYRGELQPKRSFFQYFSFLMFFPKLIAGPIVRASELLYQIPRTRTFTDEQFQGAMNLFALGYLKKVLFADNIAVFVEPVFANPMAHNRFLCIVAVYAYSMQVYFDFSAYSDMARAAAKLLGYELPLNFKQPYLAVSISDFWRRWHMTLGRWLRDYLYIPLGGNRKGRLAGYKNQFLTMLLGGLWHGANWTFVAWGALNGLFLVVEKAWHDWRGTKPPRPEDVRGFDRLWRIVVVFHLITFTRIFFRAPTFAIALDMLHAIRSPATTEARPTLGLFLIPAACLTYILLAPLKERLLKIQPRGSRLIWYSGVAFILYLLGASQAEFIYFQF